VKARALLAALGLALVASTVWLGLVLDRPDPFQRPAAIVVAVVAALSVYAAAAILVVRSRSPLGRWAFATVLVVALVARLALAVHPPALSDDVYRYVWDGRVQAAGINPYRFPPQSPALVQLRDARVYEAVNRKFAPTIYPPAAQAVFRVAYAAKPDSVRWTKLVFVGVDAIAILLLGLLLRRHGRRPELALLYAWHPLALVEVGHSGHVDVVAVALLLGSLLLSVRGRPLAAGIALAGAALVKFYALAALPALVAGGRRRAAILVAAASASAGLAYLPFLEVGTKVLGYLPGYFKEEGFDSGARFYPLLLLGLEGKAAASTYQLLAFTALAGLALLVWRGRGSEPQGTLLLLVAVLLLATPAYPWYALLPLALLPFAGPRLLLVGSALAATSFLLYVHLKVPGNPVWPLHVVWGGTGSIAVLALLSRLGFSRRRSPLRVAHES